MIALIFFVLAALASPFKSKRRGGECGAATSTDHLATQGKGPGPADERRSLVLRPALSLRDEPCSYADIDLRPERDLAGRHHRIPTNQSAEFSDGHLRLAQFDLSQKSDKVAVLLGIYCFPRFRSRTDGKEGAVARGAEGRRSSPRVVQNSPEARRCGRMHNSRLQTSHTNLAP